MVVKMSEWAFLCVFVICLCFLLDLHVLIFEHTPLNLVALNLADIVLFLCGRIQCIDMEFRLKKLSFNHWIALNWPFILRWAKHYQNFNLTTSTICVANKFKRRRWQISIYSLNLEVIYLSLIIASSNEIKIILVYILAP